MLKDRHTVPANIHFTYVESSMSEDHSTWQNVVILLAAMELLSTRRSKPHDNRIEFRIRSCVSPFLMWSPAVVREFKRPEVSQLD